MSEENIIRAVNMTPTERAVLLKKLTGAQHEAYREARDSADLAAAQKRLDNSKGKLI